MAAFNRDLPWSLLRTRWLDVPVGPKIGHASLSWGAFSEGLERSLEGVSRHIRRRVPDRERLERVVTEVIVGNLHVLVSPLGERAKLERLIAAADRVIAQRSARGPGSWLECHDGRQERHSSHSGKGNPCREASDCTSGE